jgi:hypothetical protein
VAHGYDDGAGPDGGPPIRLFVYDGHHPHAEVVLGLEPGGRHWEARPATGPGGLFLQDYARERPPYIDLGAAKGIWVNSWTPTLGGNFVAQFTARNYGDYRAHLSELRLAVRGPAGENLDRFLGGDGDPTPLEPGEERAVFKASDGFGTVAGELRHRRRRPPGPAPGRRRPGGSLARGGRRRRPGRQAVRTRPALRPGPQPQLGPVGGRHRRGRRRRTGRDGPRALPRPRRLGRRRAHLPQPPRQPGPRAPGPDAGDGPWTIEFAIEVTVLDA